MVLPEFQKYRFTDEEYKQVFDNYDGTSKYVLDHMEYYMNFMGYKSERTYEYFDTWTVKPNTDYNNVIKAFKAFASRSESLGLKELIYVSEHEDSNFHIHCYVSSYKPIKSDRYKYYQKYGHINHQKLKGTKQECISYMSKENKPRKKLFSKELIGIRQFPSNQLKE